MLSTIWEFKVRFGETDAAGIVYYPNFYKWMDQATQEMMHAAQFPSKKLMADKLGVPLVEAHCEFRKPLLFDDIVKVVSTVLEVKNKVFKVGHMFYRDDTLIAEGYETRIWVDFSDGQLKADQVPDKLRENLLSDA